MPSNCRTMLAMLASQCARLQLAAFLLLLSCSACSYAQPLAPQLALASAASKPNITVHNYTLDGQVLYTVCPCKPTWQLKAHNGTLLHLSGCANPNNDPAGPFCEIDPRETKCPNSETISMFTVNSKRLVVPCLPERKRTISGCLCSSFWTEYNDVTFSMVWPILPRKQLVAGLHEGWLLAGNCSTALQLPGGARCLVIEGSCSSMPAKAYPPPKPGIFWQIPSSDAQGWDFCGDPTYDKQRAAEPNGTVELLASLPANVVAQTQMQTQAGCTCSPGQWTYFPQQITDVNATLTSKPYLGCNNPDNDPRGSWCPVDPVACPSYYGAKQPSAPLDMPQQLWFTRVYFDYCGEARNKTEAGCLCLGNWKPTFNSSLEGQPNTNSGGIHLDPAKTKVLSGGICGNPEQLKRSRDWCFVDYNTCARPPRVQEGTANELHWDFCLSSAPATASATPSAGGHTPSAAGGIYLPTVPASQSAASPASAAGVYLPNIPADTATQESGPPAAATPPAGTVTAPAATGGTYPAGTADNTGTPVTVAAGQTQPTDHQQAGNSKKSVPIGAIVGPIIAAVVVAGAVIGLLMYKRHKQYRKKTSLEWVGRHLPDLPGGDDGDIELGPGAPGGRGGLGYQKWVGTDGTVGDKLLGVGRIAGQQQQQQHVGNDSTFPGTMQYTSGNQYSTAADPLAVEAAIAGTGAAAAAETGGVRGSSLDLFPPDSFGSSAQGSRVALIGHQQHISSSREGYHMAAAGGAANAAMSSPVSRYWTAAEEAAASAGSGSGLPNTGSSSNPAQAAMQCSAAAAAAAAAAEERAASLAVIWDSWPAGSADAAAPAAAAAGTAAITPSNTGQQLQSPAGSGDVARLASSPFASKGSAVLGALDSFPPVFEDEDQESGGTKKQQQLQQHEGGEAGGHPGSAKHQHLGISVPNRTVSPLYAPKTPKLKDAGNRVAAPSAAVGAAASKPSDPGSSSWVSWLMRPTALVTEKSVSDDDDESQLSGLTGMITERHPGPSTPPAQVPVSGVSGGAGSGATAAAGVLGMCRSVAAPATRHMSGPMMDNNWDFERSSDKPVRLLLQVNDEPGTLNPVTLLLLVSAPPPRPEIMATIVLPKDPPQAGVDLAMDANRDLAFPSNSFIGQGAFGQVHRALLRGRHPVAVKMLTDPDLRGADTDTLRSFREELVIMAKLDHPHILRCYGGNLDVASNPFIVTELCECSLDKMIGHYRRRTGSGLPLKHTLTIGLHIASALWHLHPSIVHRDLKPQNVLLDINGTAKVADFGLSRMKTHTFVSTRHVEAGTAAYMAPECFGSAGVGEKVDIYALGMLLWECIIGVRPWKGCNMVQIAFQVAMQGNRPELPPNDLSRCPAELSQLITDCWATNPKERPSSGEVMKALAHMIRIFVPER